MIFETIFVNSETISVIFENCESIFDHHLMHEPGWVSWSKYPHDHSEVPSVRDGHINNVSLINHQGCNIKKVNILKIVVVLNAEG